MRVATFWWFLVDTWAFPNYIEAEICTGCICYNVHTCYMYSWPGITLRTWPLLPLVLAFVSLPKFPIDFKVFQRKCPLQNENGLASLKRWNSTPGTCRQLSLGVHVYHSQYEAEVDPSRVRISWRLRAHAEGSSTKLAHQHQSSFCYSHYLYIFLHLLTSLLTTFLGPVCNTQCILSSDIEGKRRESSPPLPHKCSHTLLHFFSSCT